MAFCPPKTIMAKPPGLRIVGIPENCIGAVVLYRFGAPAMVRMEFAASWRDAFLVDNGDGTASPDAMGRETMLAERIVGDGRVSPHHIPEPLRPPFPFRRDGPL